MREFGWTIEYTLNLPFPVFHSLFILIKRARLDNAIDSFYTPYAAAKYGKSCQKALFDGRGSFFLDSPSEAIPEATPEQTEAATRKLRAIMAKYQNKLSETARKTL